MSNKSRSFNIGKIIDIIENFGKPRFKFIRGVFTDDEDGRCAEGVLLEYYGGYSTGTVLDSWNKMAKDLGNTPHQIGLQTINDSSNNWDEVIHKLRGIKVYHDENKNHNI